MIHEKNRVDGRGLTEDEEDHKATLWYDLEKEMKQIFKQFPKVLKSSTVIFDCALKIWETERKDMGNRAKIRKSRIGFRGDTGS